MLKAFITGVGYQIFVGLLLQLVLILLLSWYPETSTAGQLILYGIGGSGVLIITVGGGYLTSAVAARWHPVLPWMVGTTTMLLSILPAIKAYQFTLFSILFSIAAILLTVYGGYYWNKRHQPA